MIINEIVVIKTISSKKKVVFVTGKAGRLVDLCVTSEKFESKLGEYGHYCPVALNDLNMLVDCTPNDFQFAVEFKDKYYKCASIKHVEKFLGKLIIEKKC